MAQDQNALVWLDMEMTGLNPDGDRIIELAMVVTSAQLDTLAEGPVWVVHQPDAVLDAMDAWNRSTHGRTGLTAKVKAATLGEADELEAWFHYRNLDVSTLKELCKRWKPEVAKGLAKQGKHEALADIYESIDELKYYRDNFLRL